MKKFQTFTQKRKIENMGKIGFTGEESSLEWFKIADFASLYCLFLFKYILNNI